MLIAYPLNVAGSSEGHEIHEFSISRTGTRNIHKSIVTSFATWNCFLNPHFKMLFIVLIVIALAAGKSASRFHSRWFLWSVAVSSGRECSNTRSQVTNSQCSDSVLNDCRIDSSNVRDNTSCNRSNLNNVDISSTSLTDTRLSSNGNGQCRVSQCSITRGEPSSGCQISNCNIGRNWVQVACWKCENLVVSGWYNQEPVSV